ncbi:MAG TPA: polysaccharide pyruvyl transferase family protein [Candidatus Krumholzibacteria bacterium]|nr:polysaccharide pyruvyl transferase family protein [Candidatus Krumholzibacteria bacterium]
MSNGGRRLRLATFAVPLSGNKGSASMLLGLRDAFHTAGVDAHFSVFSYYPKRDAAIAAGMSDVSVHAGHPKHILVLLPMIVLRAILPALVPSSWKRDVDALRDSDGILLVGGTTFEDSMLYKVPWNLLAALPGYWLRRPTVFLSQTIGPVRHPLNRMLARWTLSRARDVHGRGRRSDAWVHKIGVEHASYQPDLSFAMAVPAFDDVADRNEVVGRFRERLRAEKRTFVGFAPNSIVFTKAKKRGIDYIAFMAGVMQKAHEQGHFPVLIPHSYRDDVSQIHNNDRSLCIAIRQLLPEHVDHFYVDADLTSQELRAMIGQLHLLVASRFHSMISSLSMGVPPITYGWGDHKYLEVLEEFNVPELYATFDALDVAAFAPRLQRFHAERDDLSRRIVAAGETVKPQSLSIPDIIARAIDAGGAR